MCISDLIQMADSGQQAANTLWQSLFKLKLTELSCILHRFSEID
jgi:hypothetical protein